MKRFLKLYHSLPPSLMSVVASLQAYALKRRRYGAIYEAALPAIRERTLWGRSRWEDFQRRQLAEVLSRAAAAIPAHRRKAALRGSETVDPLDILRKWPLMDVQHFRNHPEEYIDPDYGTRNCFVLYTSGSTGTPKKIVRDARAEQLNYAYAEARWRNNGGVKLGDRWVMIGGQLVVPVSRTRPPFWVGAYPMGQLYMSSYHLQPEFAEDYMRAIEAWRPTYVLGYASSLNMLAEFSEKTGIKPRLTCILSNAEPLYAHVRERLQRAFDCPVFDTYGGTEGAFLGFECRAGRMHMSPDFGVFEILREDGSPCAEGEVGRAVVTGLTNRAMPLIRYPTGDSVAWAVGGECRCGCSFPVLQSIEGRTDDLLQLPNGRVVGRLDPVFKADLPIREAQIALKTSGTMEVRIVPDRTADGTTKWSADHERALARELRARIGEGIPINIRLVGSIPRGSNNKFRAVVREP